MDFIGAQGFLPPQPFFLDQQNKTRIARDRSLCPQSPPGDAPVGQAFSEPQGGGQLRPLARPMRTSRHPSHPFAQSRVSRVEREVVLRSGMAVATG